ncbi:MAG: hypothetical protein GMKNLPBB_01696 [Myxococcota bacterium]|nr:hypothetical protein [Myxococcota bacterium]
MADSTPWYRSIYLWSFLIGIATLTAMRPFLVFEPRPPPVMFNLPAWTLIDQNGRRFGSQDLLGKVYVASFFFTRCPSVCPKLMQAGGDLQKRFREKGAPVQLVSFSVDPETDTPEVLSEYARKMQVDTASWTLLTGPETDIRKLIEEGYKKGLGDKIQTSEGLYDIAHSVSFVLVDQSGGVRGFYESTPLGIDEVFHRAQHVLKERK